MLLALLGLPLACCARRKERQPVPLVPDLHLVGTCSHVSEQAEYDLSESDQSLAGHCNVCRVSHRDSVEDMIARGRDLERQVLGNAIEQVKPHSPD
jgi:hypothetical protein